MGMMVSLVIQFLYFFFAKTQSYHPLFSFPTCLFLLSILPQQTHLVTLSSTGGFSWRKENTVVIMKARSTMWLSVIAGSQKSHWDLASAKSSIARPSKKQFARKTKRCV